MWKQTGILPTCPARNRGLGAALAIIGLFTFAITSIASPSSASAQAFCGDRAKVLESLSLTYSEKSVAVGLTSGGGVIEVLASPKGSWTILITQPSGVSCVMAAGDSWETLPQKTAEMDS